MLTSIILLLHYFVFYADSEAHLNQTPHTHTTTVNAMADDNQHSSTTNDLQDSLRTFLKSLDFKPNEVVDIEEKTVEACKKLSTPASFGPGGSHGLVIKEQDYKLLVNDVVVENPTAKLLVQAAKSQQDKFCDGAHLLALIGGQHLEGAKELIEKGLSCSEIISGYTKATNKLGEILEALVQEGSEIMDVRNKDQVIQCMKAPISSRLYIFEHILCPLIAEACIQVCPENHLNFNVDNVRVAWLFGATPDASKTFRGMVLKVDTVVGSIKKIQDAKVLVIDGGDDTTQQLEEAKFEEVIKALGAKVLVSGAGVGQKALQFCDDNKIMLLEIASKSELDCFCRTTEAVALPGSTVSYLGYADSILVEQTRGDRVTVTNEQGAVATVLLGARCDLIDHESLERAVVQGVYTYKALCTDSRIVPGAGATEFEIARQLRAFACKETGSDENAIAKYADSFELIPKTLAQNSILDVEDIIKNLKATHEAGNVKVGIDTVQGDCKDASTLNIWDLYTTKYNALKDAADAVCQALKCQKLESIFYALTQAKDFVLSTWKQYEETNTEMAKSLNAKPWKWLGGLVDAGDKILGLSPHGHFYSCDKVSEKVSSWEIVGILPAPELDNNSYIVNSCIVMHSDRVKHEDIVFDEDEKVVEVLMPSSIGTCKMATLVSKVYVDPLTGSSFAKKRHGHDVRVTRTDTKLIWYEGVRQHREEKGMQSGISKLTISVFDISILNGKLCKGVEYNFPHDVTRDVTWSAQNNGKIVQHQLQLNVVRVKMIASDEASVVHKLVESLHEITPTTTNVLMIHDAQISSENFHFSVERFGQPLKVKLESQESVTPKNLLKLIRGILNGIRALHIHNVAIGNLHINDIFVDEYWNVKIAPVNELREFVKKNGNAKNMNLMDTNRIATDFLDDAKADMEVVGETIFWCYTRRVYKEECHYHPPHKPEPYIPSDVVNLLDKILHQGATAIDASSHYIFWSQEKTFEFIRAFVDRLEEPRCSLRDVLKEETESVLGKEGDILVDWTTKFPQQFISIMRHGKHGDLVTEGKKDEGKKHYTYIGTNLYHLYQIIRNFLAHEDTIRREIQDLKNPRRDLAQMFNTRGGVYSLLVEKFPNLINVAYNILKEEVCEDDRFIKFYQHLNLENDL